MLYGLGDDTAATGTPSVNLTPDQLATLLHPASTEGQTFSDFLSSHVTGQVSLTTLLLVAGAAGLLFFLSMKGRVA
jgi:hypothetical protein